MGAGIAFSYNTWGGSWGNSWGNSWGVLTSNLGGAKKVYDGPDKKVEGLKEAEKFLGALFFKRKIPEEDIQVLEVAEQVPELAEEIDLIQFKYQGYLDLIESVPEYELGIIEQQQDEFIKEARLGIEKIKDTLAMSGITVELIVALLASDLDLLEISAIMAGCLLNNVCFGD